MSAVRLLQRSSVTETTNTTIMEKLTLVSSNQCFGGQQKVFSHISTELKCKMNFAVYLPPQADGGDVKLPVLYYLSGLTCTEQNFVTKAGAQRYAAEHGIILVAPDTSPRDVNIPGEDDAYDFGSGAGFYVDATEEPWANNYRMYSYLSIELYDLISQAFGNVVNVNRQGITGHSMGGHGAMVIALKNPGQYKSVSAFSPICNPSQCPWGQKAFTGYLGADTKKWEEYDSCYLVKKYNGPPLSLFVDQGTADNFYEQKQLLPENLVQACREAQLPIVFKKRDGYDHSYFYIASYIGEHIEYHAKILKA